jgi:hypothetical protein
MFIPLLGSFSFWIFWNSSTNPHGTMIFFINVHTVLHCNKNCPDKCLDLNSQYFAKLNELSSYFFLSAVYLSMLHVLISFTHHSHEVHTSSFSSDYMSWTFDILSLGPCLHPMTAVNSSELWEKIFVYRLNFGGTAQVLCMLAVVTKGKAYQMASKQFLFSVWGKSSVHNVASVD